MDVRRTVNGSPPDQPWSDVEARTLSDEALVMLVSGRDERAFEQIYDRYSDLVYSVALRIVADPAIAQDVAQEVFLRLWRAPSSYDSGRGRFANWLVSVARNRAVDEVRTRGRRRLREVGSATAIDDPPDGQVEDPSAIAQADMDSKAVRRALGGLPEEQRLTLELAYYGGLTQQEISQLLNQPLGTVKTRTRLAMKKLRLALQGEVEVGERV
jgi:RNA polymerase sigma-70 factor (ECF subfamily)